MLCHPIDCEAGLAPLISMRSFTANQWDCVCRILRRQGRNLWGKKELCCNDKEAAPAQRETVTQNVQGKGKEAGKSSSEIMDFLSRKWHKYEVLSWGAHMCQREDYKDSLLPAASSRAVPSKIIASLWNLSVGKHVHQFCAKCTLKCSQNTGVFVCDENISALLLAISLDPLDLFPSLSSSVIY